MMQNKYVRIFVSGFTVFIKNLLEQLHTQHDNEHI